jgi:predicted permease
MIGLRRIFAKLHSLFPNDRTEEELEREIAAHRALIEDDFLSQGMDPDEARRAAGRAHGNVEQAHRDKRSILWLQRARQNLRFGLRMLLKNPGLSLTILLTLALGIGANTAMFTVDYAVFLAPLPYPHPEQLVTIHSAFQGHRDWVTAGDFLDWKEQSTVFQDMNAWTGGGFNIATQEEPENVSSSHVTTGFYRMMGDRFYLGRNFLPDEGAAGKDHVAILTYRMWKRLGGDPRLLSKAIRLDGDPYTVVGVLSPGVGDKGAPVSVPLVLKSDELNHDYHWINVTGRLKAGVSITQAQMEIDAVAAHIARTYPKSSHGWSVTVEPFKNASLPNDRKSTLWLLLGAVALVLLIACVNVANLLLANGIARQKEVAVRSALGASRATVFVQFLTESLMLTVAGALLGVATGYAMLKGFIAVMPAHTLPPQADLRLNLPVFAFTLAIATLAGVLFGCAPAWFASHVDPGEAMKEGVRSGTGAGRRRLRRLFILSEFALALTLLARAGLVIHSYWNLVRVDLGVRTDHILTFVIVAPATRSKEPERIVSYYHQILANIESVPGVSHAAVMSGMPLDVPGFSMPFTIAGQPLDPSQRPGAVVQQITPDYFRTFGIRLMKGRAFTEQDNATSTKVAMVNEDFVSHFLRGVDPLRQQIVMQQFIPGVAKLGPAIDWQIVGVYHTVRSFGPRRDNAEVDIPFWQIPWDSASVGVRTTEDPASMTRSVAAAVHAIDPQMALTDARTMDQVRDEMFANDRFTMALFFSFAVIALLLASVGIYGVMAFSVAERSHEMAIRVALGATRSRVVTLIVKEGLVLALLGSALGLFGSYFMGRAMRSILYGVGAIDVSAFVLTVLLLLSAALLACIVPARRAASVDPMRSLKTE